MNREVKFRAWDKIKKEWWRDLIFIRASDGKCMLEEGSYEPPVETDFELVQYTGLKDRNDKEIYEGDVVKRDDDIFPVKYDKRKATYVCGGWGGDNELWHSIESALYTVEVIGNIYDNPELLKEK